MDNKYSKTSWKNKKEQKTYPHGKRMSAQKGGLISDYFDKWIEYVKACKHCDFKILPDDWDFQKVKTKVRCDRCGYISHFPNGKVNAKNSTPFNFGYEDQLKNKKTNKTSDISTVLVLIIFVISFIIGQTQTLEKPAQSLETGLPPIQQKIKTQSEKNTMPSALQENRTPANLLENKPIINNIAQPSNVQQQTNTINFFQEAEAEAEAEAENTIIKTEVTIKEIPIKDQIEALDINLLELDAQLDMDVNIDIVNIEAIIIKKQLRNFEQNLNISNENTLEWNKTEQMMLNAKRKLKALEEKLKLEGDWGKVRLKLDPKEQYQKLDIKYQYGF